MIERINHRLAEMVHECWTQAVKSGRSETVRALRMSDIAEARARAGRYPN